MDQKTTIKAITRHADGSGVLILQREDGSTFEADAPAEYFNSLDHQIGHPGPVEHQAPITKDDGTEQQLQDQPALRSITTHVVNEANDRLKIDVLDQPGPGGAPHLYRLHGFDSSSNPSCPFVRRYGTPAKHATLLFQCGAINEVGVNGLTHEALLAILADRLEGFQSGPFACEENERALHHLRMAACILKARTRRRMGQGIEGTMAADPKPVDPVPAAPLAARRGAGDARAGRASGGRRPGLPPAEA